MEIREARGGVLVLGGGFAGAYVARLLGVRGATIVSPENFMLFTPLLPEAASGTLEPRHCVVPLRAMCPHTDLPAAGRHSTPVGARRRGAQDPARDSFAARRVRGQGAHGPRRRDPRRNDARVHLCGRGGARRRRADSDAHARLDGRSRPAPATAHARSAARRARPRRSGRVTARPWARARLVARRQRASPESPERPSGSADEPTCTPPGAAPREEHRRRPGALRLPDARPGRDARTLQGHRRRHGPPPSGLPRLVRDALVPPLPASAPLAKASRRRRLDGLPPFPTRRGRARVARPPGRTAAALEAFLAQRRQRLVESLTRPQNTFEEIAVSTHAIG